jgi:hypothetical protein
MEVVYLFFIIVILQIIEIIILAYKKTVKENKNESIRTKNKKIIAK